jgi:hypothetical protein
MVSLTRRLLSRKGAELEGATEWVDDSGGRNCNQVGAIGGGSVSQSTLRAVAPSNSSIACAGIGLLK